MSENLVVGSATRSLPALLNSDSIRKKFEQVLGRKAAAFLSSITSACSMNTELSKADPMSIMASAMVAATLDLPINPSLGFAYMVPYKGKAQFQIGWKGLVQLAMRTGQYQTMNATVVREGEIVSENRLTGDIVFDEKKKVSDKIIGYAFYFRLINGYEKTVYWPVEKCQAHGKRYSQTFARGKGRWVDDFDAMALKTVVKNGLSKWGILSVEMQTAIESDQAVVEDDGTLTYVDVSSPERETATVDVAETLGKATETTTRPGGTAETAPQPKIDETLDGEDAPEPDSEEAPEAEPEPTLLEQIGNAWRERFLEVNPNLAVDPDVLGAQLEDYCLNHWAHMTFEDVQEKKPRWLPKLLGFIRERKIPEERFKVSASEGDAPQEPTRPKGRSK